MTLLSAKKLGKKSVVVLRNLLHDFNLVIDNNNGEMMFS